MKEESFSSKSGLQMTLKALKTFLFLGMKEGNRLACLILMQYINKLSDLDGYVEALKNTIRNIDTRVKKEITLLSDNKADKHLQKDLEKEVSVVKVKVDQVDLSLHHTKENFETRVGTLEREIIPTIQEKVKFQGDVVSINMNRVDKVEAKIDALNKMIAKANKGDFDLTHFDKMDDKIRKVENNIQIWKNDYESMVKEIRNILYQKADDESITELENKVLYKLNELVENICKKFADKTETKIGLKNLSSQIKELFSILLVIPKDTDKEEDNAMISKKPLGGVSCAS